jgi:hypothetical protein
LIEIVSQGIGVRDDERADCLDSSPDPPPAQRFDRFVSGGCGDRGVAIGAASTEPRHGGMALFVLADYWRMNSRTE